LVLKKKDCRIRDGLLKEDNRVGCLHLSHAWSLELGQRLVQVQGELSGRPAEEGSEEFLAKLKLLLEGRWILGDFEASGWAEDRFISGEAGTSA
jgi:hypothetical protein